jgi:NADH-quinone oxidoreductase subunit M
MILLGVFKAKVVIAVVAFVGVVGAAVYALRMYIASMHNRVRQEISSFDIGLRDLAALAPLVLVIIALAFYPQFVLSRSQSSVSRTVAATHISSLRVAAR